MQSGLWLLFGLVCSSFSLERSGDACSTKASKELLHGSIFLIMVAMQMLCILASSHRSGSRYMFFPLGSRFTVDLIEHTSDRIAKAQPR